MELGRTHQEGRFTTTEDTPGLDGLPGSKGLTRLVGSPNLGALTRSEGLTFPVAPVEPVRVAVLVDGDASSALVPARLVLRRQEARALPGCNQTTALRHVSTCDEEPGSEVGPGGGRS